MPGGDEGQSVRLERCVRVSDANPGVLEEFFLASAVTGQERPGQAAGERHIRRDDHGRRDVSPRSRGALCARLYWHHLQV